MVSGRSIPIRHRCVRLSPLRLNPCQMLRSWPVNHSCHPPALVRVLKRATKTTQKNSSDSSEHRIRSLPRLPVTKMKLSRDENISHQQQGSIEYKRAQREGFPYGWIYDIQASLGNVRQSTSNKFDESKSGIMRLKKVK